MKIAIVGGGVVGLPAAYALVGAGCDVVLMDKQDIPQPMTQFDEGSAKIAGQK